MGIFFLGLVILYRTIFPIYQFTRDNNLSPELFISLILNKNFTLKQYQGRTNIILLGISGTSHDGSDLTDSIILMSIDFTKNDVVLLSIPRDIWIPSLKTKVNSSYHYGQEKKNDGGITLVKSSVAEITGQTVSYAWIVDFAGFTKMIDLVGGIDVNIDRSFDDPLYPISGREDDFCGGDPTFACRYEKIHFDAGWQHLNGIMALKFVRSRNETGEEGTDFARGKRQLQVILALKDKVIKSSIWKKPSTLKNLISTFNETTKTDMNLSEKLMFFRYLFQLPDEKIRRLVIDTGDKEKKRNGFLINPPEWEYGGIWVLAPRTGDFEEIHQYISCQLQNSNCEIKP